MIETNQEARVCVLMPVQNSENTILRAINSLIAQTYGNFKILVVDDGSSDNTARVLKKIDDERLQVLVFKKSIGFVHALNWAISEIDEEYIVLSHANTQSHPQRIEKLVNFMDSNSEVGICGSKTDGSDDDLPLHNDEIRANLLMCNALIHETIIMRASLLKEKGFRYRDKYPGMADYDLWFRIMNDTEFANLNEALVKVLPERATEYHFQYSRTEATSLFVEKFTKMGIQPAEKELLVHLDLCNLQKAKKFSSPGRYKAWIDKLVHLNRSKNIFPHDKLVEILARKWKSLYPFMLKQSTKKISDYMEIEGHSKLNIVKFILRHKLKTILNI